MPTLLSRLQSGLNTLKRSLGLSGRSGSRTRRRSGSRSGSRNQVVPNNGNPNSPSKSQIRRSSRGALKKALANRAFNVSTLSIKSPKSRSRA
jgi:hypothetical protein